MMQLKGNALAFDLETTSSISHETRIVQIHMMKITPQGGCEQKTFLLNPEQPITKGAFKAHGISDEQVKDCPVFKQVCVQIYNFVADVSHIITYNGNKFDIPILVRQLQECGIFWNLDRIDFVDVMKLVHLMNPRTLGAMYEKYSGENLEGAHDAANDVMATVKLLWLMLQAHPEIPKDPKEIELFANEGKSRLDVQGVFSFNDENKIMFSNGKHKGEVVDLSLHRSYLDWMTKANKPPFAPETLEIVNKFLNNQISNS